jgi:hypothetical protein
VEERAGERRRLLHQGVHISKIMFLRPQVSDFSFSAFDKSVLTCLDLVLPDRSFGRILTTPAPNASHAWICLPLLHKKVEERAGERRRLKNVCSTKAFKFQRS